MHQLVFTATLLALLVLGARGASTYKGGASNYQGGASSNQGRASNNQGGASNNQGGASTNQGGASDNQGGASSNQGGASNYEVPYDPQEHILCVIETQLSTESCKDTARNGVYAGGDPKQACASLMAFKASLSVFGCSDADFQALKAIVCDKKKEPCKWM